MPNRSPVLYLDPPYGWVDPQGKGFYRSWVCEYQLTDFFDIPSGALAIQFVAKKRPSADTYCIRLTDDSTQLIEPVRARLYLSFQRWLVMQISQDRYHIGVEILLD
jgi:hypothetical protein